MIAYGRAGDALLALSTSGNSRNMIDALAEARRRGMVTIAMVGYDGGQIAADALADHVIVTRSQHIPRIQEAQASAYHVLRELVELAGGSIAAPPRPTRRGCASGWTGSSRASASGPSSTGSRARARARRASSCNDERGVLVEAEGDEASVERVPRPPAHEAPPLAAVESVPARPMAPPGRRGFAIVASPRPASRRRSVSADTATCDACLAELSTRPTGATAIRSSTARTAARGSRSSGASRTTGR